MVVLLASAVLTMREKKVAEKKTKCFVLKASGTEVVLTSVPLAFTIVLG